ncbi:MAG: hypothetical protein Q4F00_07440 [bacterium]|nr:hypothetical protein [bacterium]
MLENLSVTHKKRGGKSWCLSHGSRGDAPMTCMAIIVGAIILGVVAYRFLWKDRALERACTAQDITVNNRADTQAINTYRLRARDKYQPGVNAMHKRYRKLCTAVYKNKVGSKENFESDCLHLDEDIRTLLDDINEVIVPSKHADMHRNMAITLGNDWKAMCLAKEAYYATEESVKKQKMEESKKALSNANKANEAVILATQSMFKQ